MRAATRTLSTSSAAPIVRNTSEYYHTWMCNTTDWQHGGRRRPKFAAGQNLLVIIYHDLGDQQPYHELGGNYRDVHNRQATERRLIRRPEKLGSEEVSSKSAPLLPEQDFSEDEPTITYREMDAEVRTPLQVLPKAVPVRLHGCSTRHLFLLFRPL